MSLQYILDNGWFAIRPSGTEPKIKFYFGVRSAVNMTDAREKAEEIKTELMTVVKSIINA